jgi:hypothetical protein
VGYCDQIEKLSSKIGTEIEEHDMKKTRDKFLSRKRKSEKRKRKIELWDSYNERKYAENQAILDLYEDIEKVSQSCSDDFDQNDCDVLKDAIDLWNDENEKYQDFSGLSRSEDGTMNRYKGNKIFVENLYDVYYDVCDIDPEIKQKVNLRPHLIAVSTLSVIVGIWAVLFFVEFIVNKEYDFQGYEYAIFFLMLGIIIIFWGYYVNTKKQNGDGFRITTEVSGDRDNRFFDVWALGHVFRDITIAIILYQLIGIFWVSALITIVSVILFELVEQLYDNESIPNKISDIIMGVIGTIVAYFIVTIA